jgi:mannose-6-phosphate isomerase-like protein (cupin superfamily)
MNILLAGEGKPLPLGEGATFVVKEDGSLSRARLMVAEMEIAPGFVAPVQHLHHAHEESWYILDGEVEFVTGTRVNRLGPGGWALVPIGVPHTFSNPGDTPARFLAVMTPNLYLDYFVEMGRRLADLRAEGRPMTKDVREKVSRELMPKYQTEIVDPVAWEREHRG